MSKIWYNTEVEVYDSDPDGIFSTTTVTIRTCNKSLHDDLLAAIEVVRRKRIGAPNEI